MGSAVAGIPAVASAAEAVLTPLQKLQEIDDNLIRLFAQSDTSTSLGPKISNFKRKVKEAMSEGKSEEEAVTDALQLYQTDLMSMRNCEFNNMHNFLQNNGHMEKIRSCMYVANSPVRWIKGTNHEVGTRY